MRLARALAGCTLLAALAVVSSDSVLSQEKKEKDSPKVKGQLPSGWSKLNLTASQKQDIYAVQMEYKGKIEKLTEEIKKLRAEEQKKMVAVLTPEQKKMLTEAVIGESPDPKEKSKDKDKGN